jgi:hypothetical protein
VVRLARIHAVLAVRLWLQSGQAYKEGRAWSRSERRIRAAAGGRVGIAHVPDAEIHWPSLDGAPYAGQIWAIEAELTPKPLARTVGIMRRMLTRTTDYGPSEPARLDPRYAQIIYLTAPAAISIVTRPECGQSYLCQHSGLRPKMPAGCAAAGVSVPVRLSRPGPAAGAGRRRWRWPRPAG